MNPPKTYHRHIDAHRVKIRGVYLIRAGRHTYVGCSNDLTTRWAEHLTGLVAHRNPDYAKLTNAKLRALYAAGAISVADLKFEILEILPATADAFELEQCEAGWITRLRPTLNIKK